MTRETSEWMLYEKTHPTWAIQLPVDVTIPTREGVVEGEGGDYLCIDADGGLYPCEQETFEKTYRRTSTDDVDPDDLGTVTFAYVGDDGEVKRP